MGSAVPCDNICCLFRSPHLNAAVALNVEVLVAIVYAKYIFAIVPHFIYQATGIRKECLLFFCRSLAVGKNHDWNILISIIRSPLRISKDNYRPMLSSDLFLIISRR